MWIDFFFLTQQWLPSRTEHDIYRVNGIRVAIVLGIRCFCYFCNAIFLSPCIQTHTRISWNIRSVEWDVRYIQYIFIHLFRIQWIESVRAYKMLIEMHNDSAELIVRVGVWSLKRKIIIIITSNYSTETRYGRSVMGKQRDLWLKIANIYAAIIMPVGMFHLEKRQTCLK